MTKKVGSGQGITAANAVSAIEAVASAIYWHCLRDFKSDWQREAEVAADMRSAAAQARQAGNIQREQWFRDLASGADHGVRTFRDAHSAEWSKYQKAYAALRTYAPELLGSLPVVDGQDSATIDPVAAARQMQEILGQVLAKTAASGLDDSQLELDGRAPAGADKSPADSGQQNGQSKKIVPDNPDVCRLAAKIRRERDTVPNMIDIARDFTNGDEKRAKNLLRQVRRYSHLL